MMEFSAILDRFQGQVEAELRSILSGSDSPLYDLMRYHLGWVDELGRPQEGKGGKGLRPAFCLLACEGVGGDWQRAVPAAAAIELVHNFSLIHDDIQDLSAERRGRATVWRLWGQPQAINAGDAMYALARVAMLRLEDRGVAPQAVMRACRLLDAACLRLCEGQYLDICYETRLDLGVDHYLEMISGKSAALFGCSLKLGALLGTEDEELIDRLGRFGFNLGLAFQIRDDILGIWGQEQATGKSTASDIEGKKKTLPVLYALEVASGGAGEELRRIYGKDLIEPQDVTTVLEILDKLDALGYAQGMAKKYYAQALWELEGASVLPRAKQGLRTVAAFLVNREY